MVAGSYDSYDIITTVTGGGSVSPFSSGEGYERDDGWIGNQIFFDSPGVGSAPSTLGGDRYMQFSRGWIYANTVTVRYLIKDSVDSGKYKRQPTGSKIIIEMVCRTLQAGTGGFMDFVLGVKMKDGAAGSQAGANFGGLAGYGLWINQDGGAANPTVEFYKRATEESVSPSSQKTSVSLTWNHNTWTRFRFTITDNNGDDDILIEQDTSAGLDGSNYGTIHSETILSTDTNYIPWDDATYNRIGYQFTNGTGNQVQGLARIELHGINIKVREA